MSGQFAIRRMLPSRLIWLMQNVKSWSDIAGSFFTVFDHETRLDFCPIFTHFFFLRRDFRQYIETKNLKNVSYLEAALWPDDESTFTCCLLFNFVRFTWMNLLKVQKSINQNAERPSSDLLNARLRMLKTWSNNVVIGLEIRLPENILATESCMCKRSS